MYFVVTCWERTDLLALVCGVYLMVCHFPIGILGRVWYLIVSIPDLCTLTYFVFSSKSLLSFQREMAQPMLSMATRGFCAQMGGGGGGGGGGRVR